MPKNKKIKNAPPSSSWDSDVQLLTWLATCVSVISYLFYFQHSEVLLYGDAVAHINIARRVFDSKTPGLLQLGTVWLPLPHLLMIPFLISSEMWRRGEGGSFPSMAAYVLAVIGMFRLVRGSLSRVVVTDGQARIAAWTAALVFAANPNLIYMQATAMGEALYLAFFLWAVVYFSEAVRGDAKAINKCGLCVAAASLTRYDGWFLAAGMAGIVLIVNVLPEGVLGSQGSRLRLPRAALVKFLLIVAAAPALWLTYNALVYRNPLEFENGPYSAKAIERKTQSTGNPGHPGGGNLLMASQFFLKSGEVNMAENQWLQRAWVLLALAAIAGAVARYRLHRPAPAHASEAAWTPLLLLLVPVPFYALSVAYGGVPIFVPMWWPFSHYNVRYGLQLLPAFAAAVGILVNLALRAETWKGRIRAACVLGIFAVVMASYTSIWRAGPICLKEAQLNMRTRNQLETDLAVWLRHVPANSTLLMYLGDHVGAVQQAGIPLKRVINEGNHRTWKQPVDADGLWERALADPAHYADYVVAFEGDSVWQAMQARHLPEIVEIHVSGQARAVIYRAR